MVKHTQTIRRQKWTNCLSVFDHFVCLGLKGLIFSRKGSIVHHRPQTISKLVCVSLWDNNTNLYIGSCDYHLKVVKFSFLGNVLLRDWLTGPALLASDSSPNNYS